MIRIVVRPASIVLAVAVVLLATALACASSQPQQSGIDALLSLRKPDTASNPLICVIVRTYWRHGQHGENSLKDLLQSLRKQTYHNWEALLVVMDNKPFPDLRQIVRNEKDERIWVFAEWIDSRYTPRNADGSDWAPFYHENLYNLTDEAVRACPLQSEWVVITNGDNLYMSDFMARIAAARADVDLIAFDYYTRYQMPTGVPCERFGWDANEVACKRNELSWCRTDLGATAYRWLRLVRDDLRFGALGRDGTGRFSGQDGLMAQHALQNNWRVMHVNDSCLFSHSPNPQHCALSGGVWDETQAATHAHVGGTCLTCNEAKQLLKSAGNAVEQITVNITFDSHLAEFGSIGEDGLQLQCIRHVAADAQLNLLRFFGPMCADKYDVQQHGDIHWSFEANAWTRVPRPTLRGSEASYRKPYSKKSGKKQSSKRSKDEL